MSRLFTKEEFEVLYDVCPRIPCYDCMCIKLCKKVYPGQMPCNTKMKKEFVDDMLGGQFNE